MDRRSFLVLGGAALAGLAGCAEANFGEPAEFEWMVRLTPEFTEDTVGVWRGPFQPLGERGEPGEAVLEVLEVERKTLMRATMTWSRDGEPFMSEQITGAYAPAGHWNFMSTHAMVHRKGDEHFFIADILLPDGNFYRHRLARQDPVFEGASEVLVSH